MILGIQDSEMKIVTDGLVLDLDAGQLRSYPGSGATITDLSVTGTTGTLTDGASYNSSVGGNIALDGTNDYIILNSLSITTWTVCVWFKSNTVTNFKGILEWANTTSGRSGISLDTSGKPLVIYPSSFKISTGARVDNNTWTHLVGTYAGAGVSQLFVNGVSQTLGSAIGGGNANTTGKIFIGRFAVSGSPYFLNGGVAIVHIYNRVLSSDEIQQNYDAQKLRFI